MVRAGSTALEAEDDMLREQDPALAEHLAELEALAAGMRDTKAARSLRARIQDLRQVSLLLGP